MSLASIAQAPARIAHAIKSASERTGADFDYLLKTAARESAFSKTAKATTSSAAGLFQFIESTWLRMVKEVGPAVGLTDFAGEIAEMANGQYYVADAVARRDILKLRHDPEISAIMAGAFTQQNADYLTDRLGRKPTPGELYIAHFLGANGGAKFIRLAENRPDLRADIYFPRAARANRALFFEGGKARTMGQVYDGLVSKHAGPALASPAGTGKDSKSAATPAAAPGSQAPATMAALMKKAKSPMPTVKVASLEGRNLAVTTDAGAAAALGSVGQWHTILLPQLDMSVNGRPAEAGRPPRPSVAGVERSSRSRPAPGANDAAPARPSHRRASTGRVPRQPRPPSSDFGETFWQRMMSK